MNGQPYRVRYVGSGRRMKLRGMRPAEKERDWRLRLAEEQEATINRMADEGYVLDRIQGVRSSRDYAGGWTEGVWLYFRQG